MSRLHSLKERYGDFGKVSRRKTASLSKINRLRFAVTKSDLLADLEAQETKIAKAIGDFTTLLANAHTVALLDEKSKPIFDSVQSALESLLEARSSITTSKLFMSKLYQGKVVKTDPKSEDEIDKEVEEPEEPEYEVEEEEEEEEPKRVKKVKEVKVEPDQKKVKRDDAVELEFE